MITQFGKPLLFFVGLLAFSPAIAQDLAEAAPPALGYELDGLLLAKAGGTQLDGRTLRLKVGKEGKVKKSKKLVAKCGNKPVELRIKKNQRTKADYQLFAHNKSDYPVRIYINSTAPILCDYCKQHGAIVGGEKGLWLSPQSKDSVVLAATLLKLGSLTVKDFVVRCQSRTCAANQEEVNDKCVPKCSEETVRDDRGKCVPLCKAHQRMLNGKCIGCQADTAEQDGECVYSCGAFSVPYRGRCVDECYEGKARNAKGKCIKCSKEDILKGICFKKCDKGYERNQKGKCVECGDLLDNGECSLDCENPEHVRNKTSGKCEPCGAGTRKWDRGCRKICEPNSKEKHCTKPCGINEGRDQWGSCKACGKWAEVIDGKCRAKCKPDEVRFNHVDQECTPCSDPKQKIVEGKCECTKGYEPAGKKCVERCPKHRPYRRGDHKCYVCDTGFEQYENKCVEKCKGLFERVNGKCVRPCKRGKERNSKGKCVKKCTSGFERFNDKCIESCAGYEERNASGECITIPCKNPSQERVGAYCEPRCKDNEERINRNCVPRCKDNEVRDEGECKKRCGREGMVQEADGSCGCQSTFVKYDYQVCIAPCAPNQDRIGRDCYNKCSPDEERVGIDCLPKCPSNQERVERKCVKRCGSNQERVDGKCVKRCGSNQVRFDGKCTRRCNSNEERIRGRCMRQCTSSEFRDNDGTCRPRPPRCTRDQEIWQGKCVRKCLLGTRRSNSGSCERVNRRPRKKGNCGRGEKGCVNPQ